MVDADDGNMLLIFVTTIALFAHWWFENKYILTKLCLCNLENTFGLHRSNKEHLKLIRFRNICDIKLFYKRLPTSSMGDFKSKINRKHLFSNINDFRAPNVRAHLH